MGCLPAISKLRCLCANQSGSRHAVQKFHTDCDYFVKPCLSRFQLINLFFLTEQEILTASTWIIMRVDSNLISDLSDQRDYALTYLTEKCLGNNAPSR